MGRIEYLLRPPLTLQKFQFFMRSRPQEFVFVLLYLFCAVLLAVSLLGILTFPFRKRVPSERPAERRPDKQKEDAIHCEHKRGTEKYLEQIDGYLRTGLIDRAEYKVLRDRYSKLNIPDDYH